MFHSALELRHQPLCRLDAGFGFPVVLLTPSSMIHEGRKEGEALCGKRDTSVTPLTSLALPTHNDKGITS